MFLYSNHFFNFCMNMNICGFFFRCTGLLDFSHHLCVFVIMRTNVEVETEAVNEIKDGKIIKTIIIIMNEYENVRCVFVRKMHVSNSTTGRRKCFHFSFVWCAHNWNYSTNAQADARRRKEKQKKKKAFLKISKWYDFSFDSFEPQSISIQLDCCTNGILFQRLRLRFVSSSVVVKGEKQIEHHGKPSLNWNHKNMRLLRVLRRTKRIADWMATVMLMMPSPVRAAIRTNYLI